MPVQVDSRSVPLLEREVELAALAGLLAAVRDGRGRVGVVEGPPGIGKSRLLAEVATTTPDATVLRARGGELERDFPWGVVRQLFEAEVARAAPQRRRALLAGAARTAAGPLALDEADASPADASFAALHGLYWLAANLAIDAPLVLCVDDAQWADAPSLRFLVHLAARLDDIPLLLLAAQRPDPDPPDLSMLPAATVIRPAALGEAAVATLVARRIAPPEPGFVRGCHRATGGNPFLVAELLTDLVACGVEPRDAEADGLEHRGPRTVARSVLLRLAPLPAGAAALARAVAVLGTEVELRHACALAGLAEPDGVRAADALAGVDVLAPRRPLEFGHPVVRAAVRESLPPGERMAMHRRAAQLLRADGAPAERVAVHLLATEPGEHRWVVEALHDAARAALARGAPDSAAALARRALAEPAPVALRPALLRLVGRCALLAGDDTGAEHYGAAMAAAREPGEQAAIGRELGVIHVPPGGYQVAVTTLERAVEDARAAGDVELEMLTEADLLTAGRLHPETLPPTGERAGRIDPDTVAATPAGRCLLGSLAFHGLLAGWPSGRVAQLARRAAEGGLPADPTTTNTLWDCGFSLTVAEELAAAEAWWQAILDAARARGSILTFARCSCFSAMTALRGGDLPAAEAHARASVDATEGQRWYLRRMATAWLVETLVERGELDAAWTAVSAVDGHGDLPDTMMIHFLRYARGRLRVARGELDSGLADLRAFGTAKGSCLRDNPSVRPWRSEAALVEHALGRTEVARQLATEELELAAPLDSDRATGTALRALALVEGGTRVEELLGRAVTALERTPARLEHARALVDLGAAIRRGGRRSAARAPLASGMNLAHRCGAAPLVERARAELNAAGARPRRPRSTGVDALTASERRVAEMAAAGMANREIAQTLFVVLRTVEVHLTHAYAKLGISSRTDLAAALGGRG